ncbi:hypothetical protein CDV31_016598 [Fusarium ambrosium]|uniref:Uncharacterized protein n=1 Tax=Fusarium ambrosium TaxID=131363 RepID=A0A428S5X1_9HYPO|nr:hypothetical protein CDV31_016598 [Fusarium ambrosium]
MEAMREAQASLAIHCIRLHVLVKVSSRRPAERAIGPRHPRHARAAIAAAANLDLHPLADTDVMALSLADPLLRWARDRIVAGTSEPRIPVTDRLACIAMGLAPLAEVDFDNPTEAFFHTFYRHRQFWNDRPPSMAEIQSAVEYDWDWSMETIALEVGLERPV